MGLSLSLPVLLLEWLEGKVVGSIADDSPDGSPVAALLFFVSVVVVHDVRAVWAVCLLSHAFFCGGWNLSH